jgi:RimJ/RimL family protein N-acetyltransferase
MQIRAAVPQDAPALAQVIVDSGRAAHQGQVPDEVLTPLPLAEAYAASERNWLRTLHELAEDPQPHECVVVAEDEQGAVVGLAMGGPARGEAPQGTGEVYALYVLPGHHGRGIGRSLVQAVAFHLAHHGMHALRIACLAANMPARGFYERIGGQVVAERLFEDSGFLLPEVVYGWNDLQLVVAGGIAPHGSAEARVLPSIALRAVRDADLPVLFEQQLDPVAAEMAAFPSRDWRAFAAHWARIRADPTCVTQTILADGAIAGNIGSWVQDGRREVGYWLGREFWGRGIATAAQCAAPEHHRPGTTGSVRRSAQRRRARPQKYRRRPPRVGRGARASATGSLRRRRCRPRTHRAAARQESPRTAPRAAARCPARRQARPTKSR